MINYLKGPLSLSIMEAHYELLFEHVLFLTLNRAGEGVLRNKIILLKSLPYLNRNYTAWEKSKAKLRKKSKLSRYCLGFY